MEIKEYRQVAEKIIREFIEQAGANVTEVQSGFNDLLKAVSQKALLNLLDLLTDNSRKESIDTLNMGVDVNGLRTFVDKFTPTEQREAYVSSLRSILTKARNELENKLDIDKVKELDKLIDNIDLQF